MVVELVERSGRLVYVAEIRHLVLSSLVLKLWDILHVLLQRYSCILRIEIRLHDIWDNRRHPPPFLFNFLPLDILAPGMLLDKIYLVMSESVLGVFLDQSFDQRNYFFRKVPGVF